jgi:hypothetical protein
MARTLCIGNEPEFYIPHDQLPDIYLEDVKLSPDSEYLSVTGANSLTYIYRRKADGTGFYKLDWFCQHGPTAKSVVNFIGFGENDIQNKYILCPTNDGFIYQYELLGDTLELLSGLDIAKCGFRRIDWVICLITPNGNTGYQRVNIIIIGMIPYIESRKK